MRQRKALFAPLSLVMLPLLLYFGILVSGYTVGIRSIPHSTLFLYSSSVTCFVRQDRLQRPNAVFRTWGGHYEHGESFVCLQYSDDRDCFRVHGQKGIDKEIGFFHQKEGFSFTVPGKTIQVGNLILEWHPAVRLEYAFTRSLR